MSDDSWFDEVYYLEQKVAYDNAHAVDGLTTWTINSVMGAIKNSGLTVEQHYMTFGWTEKLAPNAFFDENYYVASKVAQLNSTAYQGRTDWTADQFRAAWGGQNVFLHYLQYGAYETNVEPSSGFNDDIYYAEKAAYNNAHAVYGKTDWTADSVKLAFQQSNLTAIGHYLVSGKSEGFYDPAPISTSYTLTTGIDIATANKFYGTLNPYLIDGKGPTLNSGDNLTGTAGLTDNTLYLTSVTSAMTLIPAGVTLTNIQNVDLNTNGNTVDSGTGFSTAGYSSVTKLTGATSGGYDDLYTAGNGQSGTTATAVTVKHDGYTGDVAVVGGHNVTVTNYGDDVLVGRPYTASVPLATQIATGTVTVDQESTGDGTVSVLGGVAVNVTVASSANSGAINIGNTTALTGDVQAGTIANPTGPVQVTTAGSGSVTVFGGTNVTVTDTSASTNSSEAGIVVGDALGKFAGNLASGTVSVTTAAAGAVHVFGGVDVEVHDTSTHSGAITVGNTGGLDTTGATNPDGNVVVQTAGSGDVTVFGGKMVTVTATSATAGTLQVGDQSGTSASNEASGDVSVTTAGTGGVGVFGGADVVVTDTIATKAGAILVGATTTASHATGTVSITESAAYTKTGDNQNGNIDVNGGTNVTVSTAGANTIHIGALGAPSGAVTVSNTGVVDNTATGAITVTGGNSAIVTTTGADVTISGATVGSGVIETMDGAGLGARTISITGGRSAMVNAKGQDITIANVTGQITVAQSDVFTGNGYYLDNTAAGNIAVAGGATNVSITTTGGNVSIGTASAGVSGAVLVKNQSSGVTTDSITVYGGSSAQVDTTATSGSISVNGATGDASGNGVSVVNATYADGNVAAYGTGSVDVYTNGATKVAVTGGGSCYIRDASDTNVLGTVTLTGLSTGKYSGNKFINSDALSTLSLLDTQGSVNIYASNETTGHALTITQGANNGASGSAVITVADNNAGSITINDNGTASADTLAIQAAKAGTVAVNNSAAANLNIQAEAATSLTANNTGKATIDLGDAATALATLTLTGSGAVVFSDDSIFGTGNLSHALTIDASTATGAVTATIAPLATSATGTQTFTGGAGNDTLSVESNVANWSSTVAVNGGTGTNVLVADYQAGATDTALGNAAAIKNFEVLRLGGKANSFMGSGDLYSYDASHFGAVQVGAVAGAVSIVNADANATLSVLENTSTTSGTMHSVYFTGATSVAGTNDALTITVGSGSNNIDWTKSGFIVLKGYEAVTIDSTGGSSGNAVNLVDNYATNNTGVLTITGDQSLALRATGTLTTFGATSVNATANTGAIVDVTGVSAAVTGAAFTGGSAALIATGSGVIDGSTQVIDTFTTGSGGGIYTVGGGGAWYGTDAASSTSTGDASTVKVTATASGGYTTGSETVNLAASTGKTDIVGLVSGAVTINNGTLGGINSFVIGSQSASDELTFIDGTKSIVHNVGSATAVVTDDASLASKMAHVLDTTGALGTKLKNLSYTVSNGVITFIATGGSSIGDFTTSELRAAAEIIANDTTGSGGANKVVAFSIGGATFVVASDADNTLAASATAGTFFNKDILAEMMGVTSVDGFGSTFGKGTIVSTDVVNQSNTILTTVQAQTQDCTGYAVATLNAAGASKTVSTTTTFTNLASSAEVKVSNTYAYSGSGGGSMGSVATTQVGDSGQNSLSVVLGESSVYFGTYLNTLTVAGDAELDIRTAGTIGNYTSISSVIDATGTVNTLKVSDQGNDDDYDGLTINAVTAAALAKVDLTGVNGHLTLGSSATALSANNLSVLLSDNATSSTSVFTSGNNDTFTEVDTNGDGARNGRADIYVTGNNNNINLGNGNDTVFLFGDSEVLSVGSGADTIILGGNGSTSSGDVINVASGKETDITTDENTVVNIGTAGVANVGEVIDVSKSTANGTAAAFDKTTINYLTSTSTGNGLDFSGISHLNYGKCSLLSDTVADSQVNAGGYSALQDALNMAANYDFLTSTQGAGGQKLAANSAKLDWFQYDGATYVVAMVNSTSTAVSQTGLDSDDIVVKINGLVNLASASYNTGSALLTYSIGA